MEKNEEKEEIQSRREFFKRIGRVLPIIALASVGLFNPLAIQETKASGCNGTCSGLCEGCRSCSGTCSGLCEGCRSCSGTCSGLCEGCRSCSGTCSGRCEGTCRGYK